jgi:hypothetical protein
MTIVVDPAKLDEMLAGENRNAIVTIPAPSGADVAVGELNGLMIKNMENRQAILEIITDRAKYTLPAQQINISAISEQIGASVALEDIKVQVEIGEAAADAANWVENAQEGTFTLVVSPVEFTVTATYNDKVIEITTFDAYVERALTIPDSVDPNRVTTGVVIEPDGTVRHVPTRLDLIDGRYYAVINSLTNSLYTLVWHPLEFHDMVSHWAKDAVNDMGSRMIIEGMGDGQFSPDRHVTRAEFAAMIVRGLGLKPLDGATAFSDVRPTDRFASAIHTARHYGLIVGYEDGTFRPNDKITREQAMTIAAKAMKLTGLRDRLTGTAPEEALLAFADAADTAVWAKSSLAEAMQAGILSGRNAHTLAPKGYMTRAEAATMIHRLLKKSELI